MPDADLSAAVPPGARWVKVQYRLTAKNSNTELAARLWSGDPSSAVTVRGESGFAFVRLGAPQRLSYAYPVGVELRLKVVAFKDAPPA